MARGDGHGPLAAGAATRRAIVSVALVVSTILAESAGAFVVEPGTTGNRLYVVLSNRDPQEALTGVLVQLVSPSTVIGGVTRISAPTVVPASSGAIAGFEFSVAPSAPLGSRITLVVRVTGQLDSVAREVLYPVYLTTGPAGGPVQGLVGTVSGVPGLALLDADADGVADQAEIAAGTDPFDPTSLPFVPVPSLPWPGALVLLAFVLTGTGIWWTVRRAEARR